MKIALIEDDKDNRDLLTMILKHDKHEILGYEKPSDLYKHNPLGIDFIISDGEMLGETVYDSNAVRETLYPKVNMLCVTGNHLLGYEFTCKTGFPHIMKPYNINDLLEYLK